MQYTFLDYIRDVSGVTFEQAVGGSRSFVLRHVGRVVATYDDDAFGTVSQAFLRKLKSAHPEALDFDIPCPAYGDYLSILPLYASFDVSRFSEYVHFATRDPRSITHRDARNALGLHGLVKESLASGDNLAMHLGAWFNAVHLCFRRLRSLPEFSFVLETAGHPRPVNYEEALNEWPPGTPCQLSENNIERLLQQASLTLMWGRILFKNDQCLRAPEHDFFGIIGSVKVLFESGNFGPFQPLPRLGAGCEVFSEHDASLSDKLRYWAMQNIDFNLHPQILTLYRTGFGNCPAFENRLSNRSIRKFFKLIPVSKTSLRDVLEVVKPHYADFAKTLSVTTESLEWWILGKICSKHAHIEFFDERGTVHLRRVQ